MSAIEMITWSKENSEMTVPSQLLTFAWNAK